MDRNFLANLLFALLLLATALVLRRLLTPLFAQMLGPRQGGWRALAKAFATPRALPAKKLTGQTVAIDGIIYRHSMNLAFDESGLYLEAGFPVSLIQKERLFIPWAQIEKVTEGLFFWRKAAALSLGVPAVATLTTPMTLFDAAIRPHLPAGVVMEPPR